MIFLNEAASQMGMNQEQLTSYIWQNYHPSNIWLLYSGLAISAMVLLWLYDRFVLGRVKK